METAPCLSLWEMDELMALTRHQPKPKFTHTYTHTVYMYVYIHICTVVVGSRVFMHSTTLFP